MTQLGYAPKINNETIKIEGLVKNELKVEGDEGQNLSEQISKPENKTFLKQSTKKESGRISMLDCDWEMFDCNQCDKKYNARSALYGHEHAVHLRITIYCDQCAFTTKRKGHLKNHIKKEQKKRRLK